jgi:hypothetical protein
VGRVDVAIAGAQGGVDGAGHLVGLGLPGAQADGGDLLARVEGEGAAGEPSALAGLETGDARRRVSRRLAEGRHDGLLQ